MENKAYTEHRAKIIKEIEAKKHNTYCIVGGKIWYMEIHGDFPNTVAVFGIRPIKTNK